MKNQALKIEMPNLFLQVTELKKSKDCVADMKKITDALSMFYWNLSRDGKWIHNLEKDIAVFQSESGDYSFEPCLKTHYQKRNGGFEKKIRFGDFSKNKSCLDDWSNDHIIYLKQLSDLVSPLILVGSLLLKNYTLDIDLLTTEQIEVKPSGNVRSETEYFKIERHLKGIKKVSLFDKDEGYFEGHDFSIVNLHRNSEANLTND